VTLAALKTALDAAVADLPLAELPDLLALLAGTAARATLRLNAPPAPPPADKLVNAKAMAGILAVPEGWVRDRGRRGQIPTRRLGHHVRFSPPEVLEAVRKLSPLHNSPFRGVKKTKETRGGKRPVSNGVQNGGVGQAAETAPEASCG
jgi:hypothetical protein